MGGSTIFVAGVYGVGKSTLCSRLSELLQIPAFSAGDLISALNGEQYGANKVVADKANNPSSTFKIGVYSRGVNWTDFGINTMVIKLF